MGIDVISIPRIEQFMEKFGDKALKRFLSPEEIALVKSPKTAAGFWAVKEAVSKALGCGIGKELSFFDMKIYKTPKGAPKVELLEKSKKLHNVENVEISITHDRDLAIGVALAQ
ncbi:MAG: holo-ACP synthase [Campylobacterales bacterium]|nr:holo-ACP synthase [Campylobacterales bacterium]